MCAAACVLESRSTVFFSSGDLLSDLVYFMTSNIELRNDLVHYLPVEEVELPFLVISPALAFH